MKWIAIAVCLSIAAGAAAVAADEPVSFGSPGFPPTGMDAEGRLVEDWGTLAVKLSGEGLVDGPTKIEAVKLDDLIPAARTVSNRGPVTLTCTAFRAPMFPSGVDVLTVRVEETAGQAANLTLALDVSTSVQLGVRTARVGGRTVLTLPRETQRDQELRDWGHYDEATALPGWAKPQGKCDPAFANIRAGMRGVPIHYRFAVAPRAGATVILGLCESHWAEPAQRPLACRVEGAPLQVVDPVAKWGQHKPGALAFQARDLNGDGRLEVIVRFTQGASDRNPILNAIWIFPPGETPSLQKVISGALGAVAIRYVDVGGENDQSIFPPGKLEYQLA